MHFSSTTVGVTALFILAKLAAATSFDHGDVAAAPLPNHGQFRPAHLRFAPYHRYESEENGFVSHPYRHRLTDDRYPSKDKRSEPGQVPSLTSSNNYINFCSNSHHTSGQHIKTGSCNPAPIGGIPKHRYKRRWLGSGNQAAAAKNAQVQALRSKLRQLEAPQPPPTTFRLADNRNKAIFGRATPTPPKVNFNAMNKAKNDVSSHGLPPGVYRIATMNSAANHQPVVMPTAQRGSQDDRVHFHHH